MRESFREIYERHYRDVYRFALFLTGDVARAEDLTAFSFGIALVTWNERVGFRNPGILLGVFFFTFAVVTWVASRYVTPDSWWRLLVGLDDFSVKHFGWKFGRRGRHHHED